ncbi:hypothetical protein DL96DRAFT_243052 [Flagelloscypha sp. PMI_526]|nr:hypothetical protein DL96DRAFT_243052 [Flagelloscypha sp. PMI_526]
MAPIKSHKKSRKGCRTCKKRKVKCDETNFPRCRNCTIRDINCEWPANLAPSSPPSSPLDERSASTSDIGTDFSSHPATSGEDQALSMYDSSITQTLDMVSMELLHHWTTETCQWLLYGDRRIDASSLNHLHTFSTALPRLAVGHPSLMHAILSVTSMHIHSLGHADYAGFGPRQDYYALAVHHRRLSEDQAQTPCPEKTCPGDDHCPNMATAQFMANLLISILEFGCSILDMGFDKTKQLTLLIAWLESLRKRLTAFYFLYRGHINAGPLGNVLNFTSIFTGTEDMDISSEFPAFPSSLHSISRVHSEENDPDGTGSAQAYQDTVRGLEHIHKIFTRNAPLRAIFSFPAVLPSEFIQLLEQRKPRALIILAYFCELFQGNGQLPQEKSGWWENGSTDFVSLIREMLTEKWQLYLDKIIGEARGGGTALGVSGSTAIQPQTLAAETMFEAYQ